MSTIDWIADVLPRVEAAAAGTQAEWLASMASLDAEAPSPEARESLRALARSVRALQQPAALPATPLPNDSRAAALLDDIRSEALESLEATWSESLTAAITPVTAPAGAEPFAAADASPAAQESDPETRSSDAGGIADLVARELGRTQQPPSWLWARVREDVQSSRREVIRYRRSRRLVRWASAAALIVLTASVWPIIRGSLFADRDDGNRPFDIEIISVDRPLDAASSPLAIVRRAADGD